MTDPISYPSYLALDELLKAHPAEPDLAAEILQLFSTVEAASRWATSRSGDLDESPADRVADGRAAEVLSLVRKTAHGFVG